MPVLFAVPSASPPLLLTEPAFFPLFRLPALPALLLVPPPFPLSAPLLPELPELTALPIFPEPPELELFFAFPVSEFPPPLLFSAALPPCPRFPCPVLLELPPVLAVLEVAVAF